MRILFNKILIISLLIFVSCSKSDEQSNQVDVTPSVNNIELFVSSGEILSDRRGPSAWSSSCGEIPRR